MTWGKLSNATLAWAQVHAQPAPSDGGIDFELQFRKDGPVLFTNDRPLLFMSSISEGQP